MSGHKINDDVVNQSVITDDELMMTEMTEEW